MPRLVLPRLLAGALAGLLFASCSAQNDPDAQEVWSPPVDSGERVIRSTADHKSEIAAVMNAVVNHDPTVVKIGAWSLSLSEIDEKAGETHHRRLKAVHDRRMEVVQYEVGEHLFELEAKRRGIERGELFNEVVSNAGLRPELESLRDMTDEARQQEVISQIRNQVRVAYADYILDLAKAADYSVNLTPPRIVRDIEQAFITPPLVFGPEDGVFVEIFSDFQCPYCATIAPAIEGLRKRFGNRLRVAFRNLPSPTHPAADLAARAAICANEQGGFWDYHDAIFRQRSVLVGGRPALVQLAGSQGLDSAELDRCIDDPTTREKVDQDMVNALSRGITSTPTVLVAGQTFVGVQTLETYANAVKAASN